MSPVDWDADDDLAGGGKFVYPPKVGQNATFKIKEVRKVTAGDKKFHIIRREKDADDPSVTKEINLGFHIECDLEDGKVLSITSLSPFIAFKQARVNDGDVVEMGHPERGTWMINVVGGSGKEEPVAEPVPPKSGVGEDFVLEFGTYKGKTLGHAYEQEPVYIETLASKAFRPEDEHQKEAKQWAEAVLKLHDGDEQQEG